MTAKQKKFILNKLIPFILREEGRGFVMQNWRRSVEVGQTYYSPELDSHIKSPICGTACCIGGSIEFLNGDKEEKWCGDFSAIGKLIGLNSAQSNALFDSDIEWPRPFAARYISSTTPRGRANAAAALLKEVVRTNGKCLDAA